MIKKILLFLLLVANIANSQNTLTLFTNTGVSKPDCIAFDNLNNTYVIDADYKKIIKFNSSNVQSNITADFGFFAQSQLAFNKVDGNLYLGFSIFNGGRIDKITPSGVVTQLTDPNNNQPVLGVVCDNSGNIYYSSNNSKIYKRTLNGIITEIATNVYALQLALDSNGNLITNSSFYEGIYRINVTTGLKTLIVNTANISVNRIAVNSNNNIYFSNGTGNTVFKINNNASAYSTYISGVTGGVFGLAVKDNFLYVSAQGASKIFKTTNVLGISNFNSDNFQVFPNPTKDILNLNINGQTTIDEVSLFDFTGKFIFKQKNTNAINLSCFAKGIYFVESFHDGKKATQKIIKE